MKYKAILFDMDGTLVPMDTHDFSRQYFKFLFAKLSKYNLDASAFGTNMWAGVAAMVKNDGSKTNEDAFWAAFEKLIGVPKAVINDDCIDFYGNEFQKAKTFTGENPLAVKAVKLAREKAEKVILATNPLFPMVGQYTRMSWVGLKAEDFDMITSYETDSYCKPNPAYYLDICKRMKLLTEECLMIGNDEGEDMYAASLAGMDGFLVTDCLIPDVKHPWNGNRGSFIELIDMLENL